MKELLTCKTSLKKSTTVWASWGRFLTCLGLGVYLLSRDWPFQDSKDVMVITTKQVVLAGKPILYVSHDLDDGMWQFHDGSDVSEDDAMILSLEEIVSIDESILILADLPLGWCAWRETGSNPWRRQKNE
ncbi:MAG: hypothetical protein ACM3PP_10770 [Candidatus Saccharibacteria bacterium]